MEKRIPWNLIIQKLKQEITTDEARCLEAWMETEENRAVFAELEQLWQKVQEHTADYTPDTNYYWKELSKRMKENEHKPIQKKRVWFSLRRYVAAASILLLVALSLTFYIATNLGQPEAVAQVCTNLNGKSKMLLPDGTEVWLHTETQLSYHTDFRVDDRVVNVVGEAYFDVTPDAEKPFIVQADGMRVVVHGTKFNVEAFPDSKDIFVSLLQGSVELKTDKENHYLLPGDRATYDKKSKELKVEKADIEFFTSWANEKLVFTEKPLGYVCRALARWYHIEIKLASELENKFLYTFTLRGETIEDILRLMSRINPITYSFDEENVLIITPQD